MTQPSNGESTPQANGVMYTPNPDFCGTDSFTYTVADPYGTEGSDTATVLINVLCEETTDPDTPTTDVPTRSPTGGDEDVGVPEAPIANDDEATTDQGTSVVLDVLANDVVPASKCVYSFQ